MSRSENYEIARALDELPHIVGATCATAHYREIGKVPDCEEYRSTAAKYFAEFALQIAQNKGLAGLGDYVKGRIDQESERIISGKNSQVERRYERYRDYG